MSNSRGFQYRLEGERLIIEVDLSVSLGPSATGRSELIAVGSNLTVKDGKGARLNVLVYKPRARLRARSR